MIDPQFLVAVTGFIHWIEGDPKYLTVADYERAQQIPRKIERAVKRYIDGNDWPGLDLEKVGFGWKKFSKALKAHDPDDQDQMEKLIDGLPEAPEIGGGYVGALQRVTNYVTEKMPANAEIQMTGIIERMPSRLDIYRWDRVVTLAEEPLYALEWLHEGRLTTAAVECLEAMYPAFVEQIATVAIETLATETQRAGWKLPRAKERQLSLFLGSFAAPGLQVAIQELVDKTQKEQPNPQPSAGASSKVSQSFHGTSKEA